MLSKKGPEMGELNTPYWLQYDLRFHEDPPEGGDGGSDDSEEEEESEEEEKRAERYGAA